MAFIIDIAVVLVCVVGAGFFSGIETGVISIRRLRLRHRLRGGDAAAKELAHFVDDPDKLLGTTLVGTNLCIVGASVIAARAATQLLGPEGKLVSSVVITAILVVFGEYLPKAWFRHQPYERSARFVRGLHWSWLVFRPVGVSMTWIAGLVIPGRNTRKSDLCELATRGELKSLVLEAEQHGVLTPEERGMIHRTVELADRPTEDIMTPRQKIVSVDALAVVSQLLDLARATEHRRFPVYDSASEQFTGVIEIFDVLEAQAAGPMPVSDFSKKPLLVRGDMPADEIIPALRASGQAIALVVDEEEKVTGAVTAEDVLRQIVA